MGHSIIENKKLKGRSDVRIDQLMTINMNDPSSKNIIAFQLLLESNILSCYIKNNLDRTLFTKAELDKYEEFIDYSIDKFSEKGINLNGHTDKFITHLIRKAAVSRLFYMIDPFTGYIEDKFLFVKRLSEIEIKLNENDAKDLAHFLFKNFENEEMLERISSIILNPNLINLIEYLMIGNIYKLKDEDKLHRWIMFLESKIDMYEGHHYYRLKHSLSNLFFKYNNIQDAKSFLGYERYELE